MKCALLLVLSGVCLCAERINLSHTEVQVTSVKITPDGRKVVAALRRPNYKDNRWDLELVQLDTSTKARKVLARRNANSPMLSPDGMRLAFLRSVDGKPQIFVLPMDGGEAEQISQSPTPVEGFSWRPDGKAFAYIAPEEAPKVEGEEAANKSFEADVNYLSTEAPRASHVWTIESEGGTAKRVTSGKWTATGPLHWSPDGKKLAIGYRGGPGSRYWTESTSRILDVATGELSLVAGTADLVGVDPFSPDGKHIAYTVPRDGVFDALLDLWVAPAGGGPGRNLTRELDMNIRAVEWTADGQSLIIATEKGTRLGMWRVPLDAAARQLDLTDVTAGTIALSRNGKIAWVGSEDGHPQEIYILDSAGARPRRLTDFNDGIAALELGKREGLTWRGPDSFEENGVVTYPPGYTVGQKYPLVLLIHGGPQGASLQGWSQRAQLFAANGWVVFEPNYRGSTNLGNKYQD